MRGAKKYFLVACGYSLTLKTIFKGFMMKTQHDLINLIGLKITDKNLISHFETVGLKQPKSSTPNNSSSEINDKANAVQYWFHYEVKNEACYPPKREGKPAKWITFLNSISFVNESNILKKADVKPASFWNISPPPTADLAAIKAFYGEPTKTTDDVIYFSKAINDLVEINCQFSVKQQRAQAIWAKIMEQRELISYLYFRNLAAGESDDYGSGMAEQNFQCMLIKWLHENKHLNVAQNVILPADKPAILNFVQQYLKGRLWQNQLTNQDRAFAIFVSDGITLTDESGQQFVLRFQEAGLKALGKWPEYQAIEAAGSTDGENYWDKQETYLKNIAINETNYALFANAIDENLALYNRLIQLKVNREYYYLD
jgi:hypothetical protein